MREMEYSIDESDEHLGMTRIDLEPERTPAERLALEIINDPSMHSHGSDIQWWQLPHAIAIGKVKAEATRNKWQHGRIIDGKRVRFQSIAFREKNGDAWELRSPTIPTSSRNRKRPRAPSQRRLPPNPNRRCHSRTSSSSRRSAAARSSSEFGYNNQKRSHRLFRLCDVRIFNEESTYNLFIAGIPP